MDPIRYFSSLRSKSKTTKGNKKDKVFWTEIQNVKEKINRGILEICKKSRNCALWIMSINCGKAETI